MPAGFFGRTGSGTLFFFFSPLRTALGPGGRGGGASPGARPPACDPPRPLPRPPEGVADAAVVRLDAPAHPPPPSSPRSVSCLRKNMTFAQLTPKSIRMRTFPGADLQHKVWLESCFRHVLGIVGVKLPPGKVCPPPPPPTPAVHPRLGTSVCRAARDQKGAGSYCVRYGDATCSY